MEKSRSENIQKAKCSEKEVLLKCLRSQIWKQRNRGQAKSYKKTHCQKIELVKRFFSFLFLLLFKNTFDKKAHQRNQNP